jgi:hypothetical protein
MTLQKTHDLDHQQDELIGTIAPQWKRTVPIHVYAAYTYPNKEEQGVIDEAIIDIVLHLKNL